MAMRFSLVIGQAEWSGIGETVAAASVGAAQLSNGINERCSDQAFLTEIEARGFSGLPEVEEFVDFGIIVKKIKE